MARIAVLLKQRDNSDAIMQQASSPVLQQLRSLHPGALQSLHQSPDGTLYPQTVPELQNLHTNDVYHHHQQYALNGPPPPQPPAHAIHFEQHGVPTSAQFPPFPASYQHATSPRFALTNPLPAPGPAQQQYHTSQPLPPPRPIQQLPLPLPPQPIQPHVEHVQSPQAQSQAQAREGYVLHFMAIWGRPRALRVASQALC